MKKLLRQLEKAQKRLNKLKEQAERLKEDPYKELKEAYKQGKIIQIETAGVWLDLPNPNWNEDISIYRIKPEEAKGPQIGDICKFWDEDENIYVIDVLKSIRTTSNLPYVVRYNGLGFKNCQPLDPNMTLGEVFGKEVDNE